MYYFRRGFEAVLLAGSLVDLSRTMVLLGDALKREGVLALEPWLVIGLSSFCLVDSLLVSRLEVCVKDASFAAVDFS